MKLRIFIAGALLALTTPLVAQQSLGDIARRERQKKHEPAATSHVYDNDTIPTNSTINVGSRDPFDEGGGSAQKRATAKPDDDKKTADTWRQRADEQKKEVGQLERELDVLQREKKVRASSYYYDASAKLRDPQKWAEEDRKSQEEIDAKQKQLADARQKLDNLREEARRANVPNSVTE
jgi:hypothetical protein